MILIIMVCCVRSAIYFLFKVFIKLILFDVIESDKFEIIIAI